MLLGLFSIKITQVSCSIYVKRRRSSSKLCKSERGNKIILSKQRLSRYAFLAAASYFHLKQLFNLYSTINFNQMKQRMLYKHYDIITTHSAFYIRCYKVPVNCKDGVEANLEKTSSIIIITFMSCLCLFLPHSSNANASDILCCPFQ